MRIEVDPAALIAAGQQTVALGAQLGRLSEALGSALSCGIASGMDPAGLNFGMKYGHQAGEFTSAVADAANAFSSVGMLLEANGYNYRNADAASTIGGPGPTGGVRGEPAKTLAAHVPPGPNGVTVPPPSKWYLVQPLLQALPGLGLLAGTAMTWPSGNSSMMGVTAIQWRNFATGFALIEPQLTGIKAAVGAQSIPEQAAITTALNSLGTAISTLADVASTVAQSISDFATGVQSTQDSIRRLLDRLSLDGLWDTVTGFLTGEGDDILRDVARDVGTVLNNFQQQVKGIIGLLDELTVLIGDAATAFQKWIRPILVEHFGDRVGNTLANAVTLYTDIQVGAVTGLIGTVSGVVAMADPDTWKGMAEMALSVAKDPASLPGVLATMGKEFVAWDQWSGDHPGRAAGEAAFNIGSLFVPGGALSKTGSVAKGLNLSRHVLEEGRLPRFGELGSWTRDAPNPIEPTRVPEYPPATSGSVPPVRPEGIPSAGPGAPTGAGGHSGAGPGRAGEPPAPVGRPPAPGAEGGSGQRAPVEQTGRGGPAGTPQPTGATESPSSIPDDVDRQKPNTSNSSERGYSDNGAGGNPADPAASERRDAAAAAGTHGSTTEPAFVDTHAPETNDSTAGGSDEFLEHGGNDGSDDPHGTSDEHAGVGHHDTDGVDHHHHDGPENHRPGGYPEPKLANEIFPEAEPYGHLTEEQFDRQFVDDRGWFRYPDDSDPAKPYAIPGTVRELSWETIQTELDGALLDRIGHPGGAWLAPEGTPYGERSLPPDSLGRPYHVYVVHAENPLPDGWMIEESRVAPWFGHPGGGLQYRVVAPTGESGNIEELLDSGFLREILD